ncbi:MAG TPA: YchJ family metal-binding protein, partial [Geobacteraceae bacterium]|nr:YchJ family metal-binding protein [Geobacteraceae bacterium]
MEMCPCGSGRTYEDCCGALIKGASPAGTAEQLMRSRYSAYVKVETDY